MPANDGMSPLIKEISSLLDDLIDLQRMIEVGYGDKAFRRRTESIVIRGKKLKELLLSLDSAAPVVGSESSVSAEHNVPVMILGDDGEPRLATPEDVERLRELGAPTGPMERPPRVDDFGNDEQDII